MLVDPGIASLVEAFARELMKPTRPDYVTAFLRRLDAGGVGAGAHGNKARRRHDTLTAQDRRTLQPAGRRDRQGTRRGLRVALDRRPRDLPETR